MTETTSFLPDNRPVHGVLLAHLPYTRKDMERIAEGADPANFSMKQSPAPMFGLLYLDDTGLGFFVHPSEAPMAMLFRGSAHAEPARPISFHVDYASLAAVEFIRRKTPESLLIRLAMLLVPKKDEECLVEWNGPSGYRLRFSVTTDSIEFERKFAELKNRS